MVSKPQEGKILGIPYNFNRPSIGRVLSAHWQPGEGMLVEKPFGVGYTLNLASWRSWIVLATAGALLWNERTSQPGGDGEKEDAEDPVEVVVD